MSKLGSKYLPQVSIVDFGNRNDIDFVLINTETGDATKIVTLHEIVASGVSKFQFYRQGLSADMIADGFEVDPNIQGNLLITNP